MNDTPAIDIIVPTYNRPNDLKKFIDEIQKQDYQNYKVIIVDDNSKLPIDHLIPQNDHFLYEKLNKNSGQAYVRNYAVKKGKGSIIVFMDDDAWFTQINHLSKIPQYFEEDPRAGCLMFDIKEPKRKLLSERHKLENGQELGDFIACGCAFTRSAFQSTNGFSAMFHSYGEETDIAIQLLKKGYKTIFAKDILVYHNYQPGKRTKAWKKRFIKNSVRNDLLIIALRFPWFLIIPYLFLKFGSRLLHTLKTEKNIHYSFLGLFTFFNAILFQKKLKRSPLSFSLFKHWLSIRM
ncbi:MAG: hypothetical protein PWR04_1527 [Anaerophaga sp.]|nr:hypothetical protein [Anaerophaga sp.]